MSDNETPGVLILFSALDTTPSPTALLKSVYVRYFFISNTFSDYLSPKKSAIAQNSACELSANAVLSAILLFISGGSEGTRTLDLPRDRRTL